MKPNAEQRVAGIRGKIFVGKNVLRWYWYLSKFGYTVSLVRHGLYIFFVDGRDHIDGLGLTTYACFETLSTAYRAIGEMNGLLPRSYLLFSHQRPPTLDVGVSTRKAGDWKLEDSSCFCGYFQFLDCFIIATESPLVFKELSTFKVSISIAQFK